jgi:hypothetical protein
MELLERQAVAARIRGILAGQDDGDVAAAAERLGVSELSLRMSLDDLSPQPTMDVVLAVIRQYGVDPTWLITGNYDASTHRQAVVDGPAAAQEVLRAIAGRSHPSGPRLFVDDARA